MDSTLYNKIDTVAKKYGIPSYIWEPIVYTESGANPKAVTSTGREYSVGLFQINMFAHPQYREADLLDASTNTDIAMKNFIKPAYDYLKEQGITDPKKLAVGIYSGIDPNTGNYYSASYGGIRPAWTDETQQRFTNYFDKFYNEPKTQGKYNWTQDQLSKLNDIYDNLASNEELLGKSRLDAGSQADLEGLKKDVYGNVGQSYEPDYTKVDLEFPQNIVKVVVIIGLIILLVIIILTIFPKASMVDAVKKFI